MLGKLAAVMAAPEPQLQHAALRLTARGWESAPLPVDEAAAALVVGLDLHAHEAFVEHSSRGTTARIALTPNRPAGQVTQEVVEAVRALAGPVEFDPTPQEVEWTDPLDSDESHATYDPERVAEYLTVATQAALVLNAFRAPYRGRATPVNAWWGSFDLAVNLFSGEPAKPPSDDYIMRNAMDMQEVAVGWWPGSDRYPKPAFYAYAHPAPEGFAGGNLSPEAAHWNDELGEFVLDWADVVAAGDPHAAALEFARSAFQHACLVCGWNPELPASAAGDPPPVA